MFTPRSYIPKKELKYPEGPITVGGAAGVLTDAIKAEMNKAYNDAYISAINSGVSAANATAMALTKAKEVGKKRGVQAAKLGAMPFLVLGGAAMAATNKAMETASKVSKAAIEAKKQTGQAVYDVQAKGRADRLISRYKGIIGECASFSKSYPNYLKSDCSEGIKYINVFGRRRRSRRKSSRKQSRRSRRGSRKGSRSIHKQAAAAMRFWRSGQAKNLKQGWAMVRSGKSRGRKSRGRRTRRSKK